MVLFKKDWETSGAVADVNTSNQTFLRYSQLLKKMGIENHLFPLTLLNTNLLGIDPWSDKLTESEIIQITTECRLNPWYYFREVVRVPAVAGAEDVPFRANRGNMALFWLFFNHITSLLIQPRQTGKSVSTDTLMSYLLAIGTINTKMSLLTKDEKLRTANVLRLREILDGLPFYLRLRGKGDTYNTEKITVNALGNSYITMVPQMSEKAAANIGRGHTIAINHVDEIAFITNIHITLPALLAASSAAFDAAEQAGSPYGTIFTTTAGFLSSKSGEYCKTKIYDQCLRWTEKLYDLEDEQDLRSTIMKNNPYKKTHVLLEFNHRQLGYTDDWLRRKIADAMSDPVSAQADFLNKWAEGSETSPLDRKVLKKIVDSSRDEEYAEITKHGYIIRWYVSEEEVEEGLPDRMLIVGLDTSDAIGKDDIAMCVRDASTGEVVAAGEYNETNIITFADWIANLLMEYENMILVPERKSTGASIIDYLLQILPANNIDPFERIFNWVVNDSDINPKFRDQVVGVPFRNRGPEVYSKFKQEFGYATSSTGRAARDNLYGTSFLASTKYTGHLCRDKTLIGQLSKLVRKNNRIDHRPGEHDDMVIAYMLSYWFLTQAKNKSFYGLSHNDILSTVTTAMIEEEGGIEAVKEKQRQHALRTQIEGLLNDLAVENNPYKSTIITSRIKRLYEDIDTDTKNTFDIDNLIENIQTEKRKQANRHFYY